MMRLFGLLLAFIAFWSPGRAAGADIAELYRATAIVTGTREETRLKGFEDCLRSVLLKVSGDQRVLADPRLAPLLAKASNLITAFHYHDRMSGIPIHDEQGTHDRPFDLTCDFEQGKLDAMLASLGEKPWTAPRPSIALFVSVRNGPSAFVLAADDRDSAIMREAFAEAAEALAIPILFPKREDLRRIGLDAGSLPRTGLPVFDAFAGEIGGSRALAGSIVWSDREMGWVAEWRFFDGRGTAIWQVHGVNFDKAFQSAMRGVAQILSGNGDPPAR
ncbi:MAG: DUF2066 domain-containing protein [Rhizobiales bacterium]|jgi:hypothetical protein|nr:DUF2066 domain-containing protein [Hyphomicrobiales bacterium]